jgi:8-oxo-dGTP pyrophosphatase MutT (NUDIX family)
VPLLIAIRKTFAGTNRVCCCAVLLLLQRSHTYALTRHRKRTERVYLVVKKDRPADEHDWGFPQGGVDNKHDNNSLRATAERELAEECGPELSVHPMGNAPIGHLQYKYKPEVVKKLNADGQKVYYHHMIYLEGDIKLDRREVIDYAWATKSELIEKYFKNTPDLSALTQKILP